MQPSSFPTLRSHSAHLLCFFLAMENMKSDIQAWTFFVTLHVLILVSKLSSAKAADVNTTSSNSVSEISCRSNVDLQSFLPPPYGNISTFACRPVWHTFELRYSHSEDDVTTIILSAPYTTGWIGIGFSKDGMMVGSSAMVGYINRKGQARAKQYYIQGKKADEVIVDKGEVPLSNIPAAVTVHGAQIYLSFQLQTTSPLNHQHLLLAFGSKYPHNFHLPKHDDKTAIHFDFSSALSGSKVFAYGNLNQQKKRHGVVGILGWGLFLPIGAIIPRYLKHKDPLWFYLHTGIQVVGFALGLTTMLLGLQLYTRLKAHIPAHRGIGIFIFVLSLLQMMAVVSRPNKDSKIRRYWNWYHGWSGRIALFFGAVNIVLGMQAAGAGNDWKIGYGFLVSITIIVVIVLEALAYMKRSEKKHLHPTLQLDPVL